MKRFLSWVVLCLGSCLVSSLTSYVVIFSNHALELIGELSAVVQVIIYFFGGTALIFLLGVPAYQGLLLSMFASDAIESSRNGTRYVVLAIIMLLLCVARVAAGVRQHMFHLDSIIMGLYYIAMVFTGQSMTNKTKRVKGCSE